PEATASPTAVAATSAGSLTPSAGPFVAEDPLPAPECGALAATAANAEGPYYKPDSPERASLLEDGVTGARLSLTGYVLTLDCRPLAGARLDFWQADATGEYDNAGFRLRGHQFSDEAGRYRLETVLPAPYGSRPRHIHVKVQPPGGPILTTQLYFPDDSQAASDPIFDPRLIVDLTPEGEGYEAVFHFVLDLVRGS
ncbi:MAG: hypothetical protein ACRDHY_17870, partial [Anaerolineales bacterium]